MKNYIKKVSIIFLILLAIVGIQSLQNGTVANAATVGEKLLEPEDGWARYDDKDIRMLYGGRWLTIPNNNDKLYEGNCHYTTSSSVGGETVKFKFYGTKLRIVNSKGHEYAGANVKIDGVDYGNFTSYYEDDMIYSVGFCLFFEKLDLTKAIHDVVITTVNKSNFVPKPLYGSFQFDAIDIDSTGELLSYTDDQLIVASGISLNKTSDSLQVGQTDNLVATVTLEDTTNKNVTWTSSDTSIATVDENGKVTAIKAGTATITATTTDGSNIAATCTITVAEPTSEATLYIEFVNGHKNQYTLSQNEINKFIEWYENRDKDKTLSSFYKFAMGTYTDYVVHNKIVWFEVR